MLKGRCECGAVAFEVTGTRKEITMCHCKQCRRLSGHHWAATRAPFDQLTFTNDAGLKWYTSSTWAKRGFCGECGSSLFYRMNDEDGIGIAAGCLDDERRTSKSSREQPCQIFQPRPAWSLSAAALSVSPRCIIWRRRAGPIVSCLKRTS